MMTTEGNVDANEATDYMLKKQMVLRMNMMILHKKFEKATHVLPLQFTESTDTSMISLLVSLEFPQILSSDKLSSTDRDGNLYGYPLHHIPPRTSI